MKLGKCATRTLKRKRPALEHPIYKATALFNGKIHFVKILFPNLTVSDADVNTGIKYATLASKPIQQYCSQYGPNSVTIDQTLYTLDAPNSNFSDANLQAWVETVSSKYSFSQSDAVAVLSPPGANNTDAPLSQGTLGYHGNTGRHPYIFVNMEGTGLTVDDKADVYADALSHELAEMCLVGDTKIPLLDGTEVAVKDLVGRDHFWVYSSKENGEMRPGRGHSARITQHDAEVIKVTLDNGESISCTSNHKFLMRDGSYKEAQELCPDDSLMPLYRDVRVLDENKQRKGMYAYEHLYVPATDGWVPTHRMVIPYCSEGYVRHHADFNRFNNSPEN